MKPIRVLLGLVPLLLFVPGSAEAGKFYLGGSYTRAEVDLGADAVDDGSFTSSKVDNEDDGWTVFAGFRFMKFFALEADIIDVGRVKVDAVSDGSGFDFVAGPVVATSEIDGYRLSALATLPVGERLSLYARYGFFEWDAKSSIDNGGLTVRDKSDGRDDFYGAGVAWKFRGGTSLRVEYQKTTIEDVDVDFASIGLAWGF